MEWKSNDEAIILLDEFTVFTLPTEEEAEEEEEEEERYEMWEGEGEGEGLVIRWSTF